MKKLLFISLFGLITQGLFGQSNHNAWLDSIASESYIGIEVTLDEIEFSAKHDSLCDPTFGFYKNNPLNSTDDVLSRLPGVSMIRRGNYAWEPTINGLNSGQINVVIDGMRMFGACTDKMDPVSSYVEPNNLESVKIEKGSSGSEHGSTIGGAVAFNLKQPKFSSGWFGDVSSRYESVSNGFSQSASLNYGQERFAVRINGSYRNFKDYKDGNGDTVFPSGYEKLNTSISAAYRTNHNNLINVDLLMDDAYDVGYPGLPMDVAFALARMGAISYTMWRPISSVDQLEIKGYANSVNHLMDDSKRSDVPVRMDMPGRTQTVGAFVKASFKPIHNHKITAKIDWYGTEAYADMTMFIPNEVDMFMITWGDIVRQDLGLYVVDDIFLTNKVRLNLNARVEFANTDLSNEMAQQQFSVFGYEEGDFQTNDRILNTGASLGYQFSDHLSSKLSISYGERLPSSSELFGFYLYNSFDGFDYVGNPDIKKERSTQLFTSLEYTKNDLLQISVSGFYYWFDDYIIGFIDESLDPMTIGASGVKVYENIQGVTFRGFDAQLSSSPSRYFQFLYNLKATYADDKQGNPLPLIPPLKSYCTVIGQKSGYKLQIDGEWSSAQERISENTGEQATDAYFLMHLRLTKDFNWTNFKFSSSAGVENLFDKDYRDHLDWGGILRPGRNIYASIKLQF